MTLNGQKSGTFACGGGLFFAVTLTNPASAPLHADSLLLNFTSQSTACVSHPAPIEKGVNTDYPPGATEVRRVDLAGDLCKAPFGQPGCQWQAAVSLTTRAGVLMDGIQFATSAAASAPQPQPTPTPTPTPTANQPPEIKRLEWTARGNTTGGDPPLPSEKAQTYCGVLAHARGALNVTLSYRDTNSGCKVKARCWTYGRTYQVQRGESILLENDFRPPGDPTVDSYALKVTCTAEEGGLSVSRSICLPVPRGC